MAGSAQATGWGHGRTDDDHPADSGRADRMIFSLDCGIMMMANTDRGVCVLTPSERLCSPEPLAASWGFSLLEVRAMFRDVAQ